MDQIRIKTINAVEAKGPMFARHVIEKEMYRNEKYYLLIDSHTKFTPKWDVHFIEMLKQCPSEKPILTMYPANHNAIGTNKKKIIKLDSSSSSKTKSSYLRFKKFNKKSGLPEIEGPLYRMQPLSPQKSIFWAACCSFTLGEIIKQAPFDPNYQYVFMGEEIAMAARYYTSGWDFYNPTFMIITHLWERKRPTFWEQFTGDSALHKQRRLLEQSGYRRLRHLFQLEALEPRDPPLVGYSLGTARTLQEFERYCGINFLLQTVQKHARLGLSPDADQQEILCKLGSLSAT
jgi:hypothetical protein